MIEIAKVAVLLAAYNGENFIKSQVDSILSQKDVLIDIFISLDKSTDNSFQIINSLCIAHKNIKLLPYGERFGNAGKNFYHLINEVNFSEYDFIAFSDQDDIWLNEKIFSAVKKINHYSAAAYSSDVIAYWPKENKKIIIKKSFPQKKHDYIFEAAGPGCTYVFKKYFAIQFQEFLRRNWDTSQHIELHDWYIYAFARAREEKWFIDPTPHILYRQHNNNLVGINKGIKAIKKRLDSIKNHTWINQCMRIYSATKNKPIYPFESISKNINSRLHFLKLISSTRNLRRNPKESFYLKLFFLYFSINPPKNKKHD